MKKLPLNHRESIFEKTSSYKKPYIGYEEKFFPINYKIRKDPSPGPFSYETHNLNSIEYKYKKRALIGNGEGVMAKRYD